MAESATPARNEWNDEGYDAPPEVKTAAGHELIYRAYGGGSRRVGNCFFTPCVEKILVSHWTAELLERELNASLWGNDFEKIAKFQICQGTPYKIGGIAHDHYSGVDGRSSFYQRSFITPANIFKQISFVITSPRGSPIPWETMIKDLNQDFSIKPGRYAREASRRGKRFTQ